MAKGGQEADLQGRPDSGPQHEAPFLFPSHQGAPPLWRSLALVPFLLRHIHPEAESGIEGHYLMLMAAARECDAVCAPGDPFTRRRQIFHQV